MGLHAKWTTTCDHCGKQEVKELTPEQDDCIYLDIWGPGFPLNWFHQPDESSHQMFCSMDCLELWLRAHDRSVEADLLNGAVWVA